MKYCLTCGNFCFYDIFFKAYTCKCTMEFITEEEKEIEEDIDEEFDDQIREAMLEESEEFEFIEDIKKE